jgi:hypothetical protein
MNETLHRQAGEFADEFIATMVDILGQPDLESDAVSSWPTSYVKLYPEHLSSKLIINKWLDAFKEPVFTNPNTVDEAFSVNYTSAQCDVALDRIEGKIEEWIGRTCCLGLLDTNAVAFKSNTKGFWSAGQLLTAKYLFVRMNALPGDELVLYMKGPLHAILLHRPWSLAADSRVIISRSWLFLRGFTVAVTTNIVRAMHGRPQLSPTETFGNPIHAMMIAMIVRFCLHMNRYIAVCFYKDVMTEPETNALTQNRLAKQLAQRNLSQRVQRKRDELPTRATSRVNDVDIQLKAQAILTCPTAVPPDIFDVFTVHDADGPVGPLGQQLMNLFAEPGKDGKPLADGGSMRWSVLLREHCQIGSLVHNLLLCLREHMTANPGNSLTGPGKRDKDEDVKKKDAFMAQLVKDHGPAKDATPGESGKPFWLSRTKRTDESLPETARLRRHPVQMEMTYDGVRGRCKPAKKGDGTHFVKHIKGHTGHTKSVKYPHLKCQAVSSRKNGGHVPDVWNKEKSLSFVLVQLTLRPPVAGTDANTDADTRDD